MEKNLGRENITVNLSKNDYALYALTGLNFLYIGYNFISEGKFRLVERVSLVGLRIVSLLASTSSAVKTPTIKERGLKYLYCFSTLEILDLAFGSSASICDGNE